MTAAGALNAPVRQLSFTVLPVSVSVDGLTYYSNIETIEFVCRRCKRLMHVRGRAGIALD